jgi:hypothetical protein
MTCLLCRPTHFKKRACRPTACVTCAGAGGGTPSNEKKAEAEKMPEKRADSPASSARFVGRRYRDELDSSEHASTKHLRQHGFESPEKLCVASADEPSTNPSRSTLCAAKITWKTFHIISCGAVCALLTGAILHDPQANSRYFSRRPTVCVRYSKPCQGRIAMAMSNMALSSPIRQVLKFSPGGLQ